MVNKLNTNSIAANLLTASIAEAYYNQLDEELKELVNMTALESNLDIFSSELTELVDLFSQFINDEVISTKSINNKPSTYFKYKNGRTYYSTFEKN